MSKSFPVNTGVKQGWVLAPTLFGIFFSVLLYHAFGNHEDENDVYIHTRSDGNCSIWLAYVQKLKFAKSWYVNSSSRMMLHSFHTVLNKFSAACSELAMVISTKKTVVMQQGDPSPIMVNGQELESVENSAYLGSTINRGLIIEQELQTRIGRAASSFSRLRERAWQNKYLTIRTKCLIYECCILSTQSALRDRNLDHICPPRKEAECLPSPLPTAHHGVKLVGQNHK